MVKKRRMSKRLTLKDRYKIEKKVAEHRRKVRKQFRRDVKSGAVERRTLRKDPGVPNLWPLKDELLRQLEERKARQEERKARRLEELRNHHPGPSGEELLSASTGAREEEFTQSRKRAREEGEDDDEEEEENGLAGKRVRHAGGTLKSIVDEADVLIEVLDARDPEGCRSREVEDMITTKGKKLVLLLNKTDLVPKEVCRGWLQSLRREFPCLPFRASTSKQKNNIQKAAGMDELMRLLKNYARDGTSSSKQAVIVGVVGCPNVGKSSIVNSLKLKRAATTSSTAGSTTHSQHYQIDSKLILIDTPGVATRGNVAAKNEAVAALRKCLALGPDGDAQSAVESLVKYCPKEQLMSEYGVKSYATPTEFLVLLARQSGKLGKGGVLDLEAAARRVINDCGRGKLRLFVAPPSNDNVDNNKNNNGEEGSPEVVEEFSSEFRFADDEEDGEMIM